VNGQLHAPAALLSGEEPLLSVGYEVGWTPEPVWTLRTIDVSLMCSVRNLTTIPTRCLSLFTLVSELFCIHCFRLA